MPIHCQEKHPSLSKISYFDMVPGVDYVHADDFEWATFVKKYFREYLTPELALTLTQTPKCIDYDLIQYWERLINDKKGSGVLGRHLDVVCLRCYNVSQKIKLFTKLSLKFHIKRAHCTEEE